MRLAPAPRQDNPDTPARQQQIRARPQRVPRQERLLADDRPLANQFVFKHSQDPEATPEGHAGLLEDGEDLSKG